MTINLINMKRINFIIAGMLLACTPAIAQDAEQQAQINKIAELAKTNTNEASTYAEDLIKQNKKDLNMIIGVGRAFMDAKNLTEADKYLQMAKKLKPNTATTLVFEGDLWVEKKDPGSACQSYEQAIYFEPKNETAYMRYADIYKAMDPTGAIQKLKDLKEKRPDLKNVDAKIGEVYYTSNMFKEAAETYTSIDPSLMDEKNTQNFAFALFMSHDYNKSLEITNLGLQKYPRSAAFNRLAMFNDTELKNYDAAIQAANNLFNNTDKPEFSYLDYTYYGYALVGAKKYSEAIDQFKKALEMNDSRTDVIKALSDAYEETADYQNAIDFYKSYLSKLDANEMGADKIFQLGKLYYAWGSNKKMEGPTLATQRNKVLESADSAFAKVAELAPESYLGNMWRARTNSQLDPESDKGLAKPYYEATATLLAAKGENAKFTSQLVECYSYLGYYCMNKKLNSESKSYWNKVLSIDPTNATAKKAISILK
jgi:tetratricopeptide (TPR) repeat protein